MRSATKGFWRIAALLQVVALSRHQWEMDAMSIIGAVLLCVGAYIGWSE